MLSSPSSSPFTSLRDKSSLSSTEQSSQHLQSPNRVTTPKLRNMADHTSITIQVGTERDDDQQPQNQPQQQQGWLDSALKFHVEFGLLKLLMITRFRSIYIICEVIYLISLIEVTGSVSPNQVYWYLYIASGTLGFELLLWTNLSLVMWLVTNFCLLVYALASSGLLARSSDRLLQLVQPLDDMSLSDVQIDL